MLRTALVIGGDTAEARAALDQLDRSVEQAEANARELAAAFSAVDVSTTRLATAQTTAAGQVAATRAAYEAGEIGLEQYNRELLETKNGLQLVENEHRQHMNTLKAARSAYVDADDGIQQLNRSMTSQQMGVQQLTMNLSDMTTMWALGARPQQIFASQMGQVIQSLQLMSGGTSKFAAFMANPWVAAITLGTMVLVPLVGKLFETGEAAEAAEFATYGFKDAQSILGGVMDLTTGKINTQSEALLALARAQAIAGRIGAETRAAEARSAVTGLQDEPFFTGRGPWGIQRDPLKGKGPTGQISSQLLNGVITGKEAIEKLERLQNVGRITNETFLEAAAAIANLGVEAENIKVFEQLEKALDGDKAATEGFLNRSKDRKQGLSDEERAYKQAFDGAQSYIAGLELEIAKAGLSEKALRALEATRAADAAATDAQRAKILDLNRAREDAIALEEAQAASRSIAEDTARLGLSSADLYEQEQIAAAAKAATDALAASSEQARDALYAESQAITDNLAKWKARTAEVEAQEYERNVLEPLKREAAALGFVGWERERLLITMRFQAEQQVDLARLANAEAEGNAKLVEQLQRQIAARAQAYDIEVNMGDTEQRWHREREAVARLNDELTDLVRLLQNVGGAGDMLGGLLAILSGNYDALGGGPMGDFLSHVLSIRTGTTKLENGEEVAVLFGDQIRGALGDHASVLVAALQGAGIGAAGAKAAGGNSTIGAGMGAAMQLLGMSNPMIGMYSAAVGISNLLGEQIEKLTGLRYSKTGGQIGGLLGGFIGGAISGADRGAAIISGGKVSGYYGDTQKYKDHAGDIAGGILDTLAQIADRFGEEIDAKAMGKVSIGIRDGKYVVDPKGRGYTKTSEYPELKSFGKDAEAAAEYALKLMLERGAIEMRDGALKIIKEAKDLQTGLEEALTFDAIMDQLEGGSSQLVRQVKAIRTEFDGYIAVMKKAGSAAADLTRVQEMQAERIREIIAAAGASYRSTFYSNSQNVAFAKQQIAGTLNPLGKGSIDTVAEYMAAVEAAQLDTTEAGLAWLDTLYQLSDEFAVLKNAADAAAAAAAAEAAQKQADAAAAAAERERERQEAARAKAAAIEDARQNLRDAFERSEVERQATIERMGAIGDGFRDILADIAGEANGGASFAAAQARMRDLAHKGNVLGDRDALAQLGAAVNDFLPAAEAQARSAVELARYRAEAQRILLSGIGSAEAAATIEQQALDAERAQVEKLVDLNKGVLSVREAILELKALLGGSSGSGGGTPTPTPTPTPAASQPVRQPQPSGRDRMNDFLERLTQRNEERESEYARERAERDAERRALRDGLRDIAVATERNTQLLSRFDGNDRLRVQIVEDDEE